jgi:hypothetical protein
MYIFLLTAFSAWWSQVNNGATVLICNTRGPFKEKSFQGPLVRFGNTCLFTGLVCTRRLPGSPSKFIPYCCMWISAAFTPNPIVYDYIITPLEKFIGIGFHSFYKPIVIHFLP